MSKEETLIRLVSDETPTIAKHGMVVSIACDSFKHAEELFNILVYFANQESTLDQMIDLKIEEDDSERYLE